MLTLNRRTRTPEANRGQEVWEPFRLVREMTNWDPFAQLTALPQTPSFVPAFEVKEADGAFVFKADLPGVEDKDLEIALTGNRLTISGKREREKRDENERYFSYERTFGSFSRSFTLPDGCDGEHVTADLKGGVLTLVVPKKPEVQARRISINAKPSA